MNEYCILCGLPVSRATPNDMLQLVLNRIDSREGAWLMTLNTEMLSRFTREPSYHDLLSRADLITADGMPLVWASRFKGRDKAIPSRSTGVDLVNAYLRLPVIPPFAVIGGIDPAATIEKYGVEARAACRYLFDGKIDLTDAQTAEFATALRDNQVRMLFLALGGSRQDQLAYKLRQLVPDIVIAGVGGSFEILGPKGRRAPEWMQRTGLEWLFRLSREPGRLWRRYLLQYPAGISLLIKDCLRHRPN